MEQTKQAAHAPVVLVTGAARRAGRAFAEYFAKHGYRTAVHYDRSADAAQAAARAIAERAFLAALPRDVVSVEAV